MAYLRVVTNGTTGAGNGAPSSATAGVPLRRGALGQSSDQGLPEDVDECTILVEGVGTGSATNSIAYVKLWGYFEKAVAASSGSKWFPLGTATTDADRGKLNEATAIGEVLADRINFAERIRGLADATRVYAEYGALTQVTRVDITIVSAAISRLG